MPKPRELENRWLHPSLCYGDGDAHIRKSFQNAEISQRKWKRACNIVDPILSNLLKEMSTIAKEKYGELQISDLYVRQGSARQGMKVIAPDEFDVIMPFSIVDLAVKSQPTLDVNKRKVPGLVKLTSTFPMDTIEAWYPNLSKNGVFERDNQGTTVLNARELQKSVFNSLLDKALIKVNSSPAASNYKINRRVDPPTMKISITEMGYTEGSVIDIDVVPGMLVGEDDVHIPIDVTGREEFIKFPRYVVMKWVNRKDPTVPEHQKDYLWRMSSTAFERYMTDICVGNPDRMYILTACMILKSLFSEMKAKQNQVSVLFKSYYLKNICLYLIMFLTILKKKKISGVREALGYFLKFIKLTLDTKRLPSFFLGNQRLVNIFPNSYFAETLQPYNMFKKEKEELVEHARHAFKGVEERLSGCYDYDILEEAFINAFTRLLRTC